MNNKDLLDKVGKLGLPMFEKAEEFDANLILYEVVQSHNLRLWEGLPILLLNANKVHLFNYKDTIILFQNDRSNKVAFIKLIVMSLSLYKYYGLTFSWTKEIENQIGGKEKNSFSKYISHFKKNEEIPISNYRLDTVRIKNTFNRYFKKNRKSKKVESIAKDLFLEFSLSQLFSPKQKQLFLKKLQGEKLLKTEREYYSRIVKKKVMALSNPELHLLAKEILEQ